jgi:prevent-host-death family protein
MKTVTAAYAKIHLPELLNTVAQGESITISRYNKPVAELVPSKALEKPAPKFGTGKGKFKPNDPDWARAMTDEEADAFIEGRY